MARIEHGELLSDIFGRLPESFALASVISFSMKRDGEGQYRGPTIDATVHLKGYDCRHGKPGPQSSVHVFACLRFFEVQQLKLTDFSHDNSGELRISDISDRQMENVRFDVHFAADAFDFDCRFLCRAVAVNSASR